MGRLKAAPTSDDMRRLLARLINVLRPERAEADLEREIAAHLALLEDEYRRRGMSEDEARFAARRAIGGPARAQDLHRDARSFVWLDDLRRDLTHAARSLKRNPGFTVVAVLTLALGIGANTAIFSVISALLLRPLSYHDADRLVQIFSPTEDPSYPRAGRALLPAHFDALRGGAQVLGHVTGYIQSSATLIGQGDAVRLAGLETTASTFPMLGVPPMLGRAFESREESAGSDAVVVLSHAAWQRYFNGDRNVIGRVIDLDGRGRTVVGVMPDGFMFPDPYVQYWVPYVPPLPNSGRFFSLTTLARLREGVSTTTAESEVTSIVRAIDTRVTGRFEVNGIQDELVAPVKPALLMLTAAVGLVLLIACVNVANLLLARYSGARARDRGAARDWRVARSARTSTPDRKRTACPAWRRGRHCARVRVDPVASGARHKPASPRSWSGSEPAAARRNQHRSAGAAVHARGRAGDRRALWAAAGRSPLETECPA